MPVETLETPGSVLTLVKTPAHPHAQKFQVAKLPSGNPTGTRAQESSRHLDPTGPACGGGAARAGGGGAGGWRGGVGGV